MRRSHSTSGRKEEEEEEEDGSVGIKTGGGRKKMERESFVQPSITFLGFKFIWLHFSLIYTAAGEKLRGAERKGGRQRRKQHEGGGGGGT